MRRIPNRTKNKLKSEPDVCARRNEKCAGFLTWEHAIIYAGRQLNEPWAIIKLCEYHHAVGMYQDGGDLDKTMNEKIALNRATDEELRAYSKATDLLAKRDYLNENYPDR